MSRQFPLAARGGRAACAPPLPAGALRTKAQLAAQLQAAMRAAGLTKAELARRMGTSRSALDRLLDAGDTGLTLATLASVAAALGRQVELRLVTAPAEPAPAEAAVPACP